jgi:type I restriction enzyme M protein
MRLTKQQLEAHLWGASNIPRSNTAGQDYEGHIPSMMFYKRLCDQRENEADEAIAELECQQGRQLTAEQKAVLRARGEKLTQAIRTVSSVNEKLSGVFTVDWNQPALDCSSKPLIPNEVLHALIQHFDSYDLSNASVPPDVIGRADECPTKQFADGAGVISGGFFTPFAVVDTLVRILEFQPGDAGYDPTCRSGGMLLHSADFLRENGHHATSVQCFGQELNWGSAAIGKINSVLHELKASIEARVFTITDPAFKDTEGKVRRFSLVLANFPFTDEFWWLKPEQQTDHKKKGTENDKC